MCRTSASAAPRAYVSSWACTGDTSRAKRSFACKTQAAFAREDTDTLGRISDRRLRYSLVDAMVERGCTRVVDGELNSPTKAVEFLTFRKDGCASGKGWQLSAIRQAA